MRTLRMFLLGLSKKVITMRLNERKQETFENKPKITN